jgi:gluconolactonase
MNSQSAALLAQAVVRYPDPAIEVLDPRFTRYRLANAAVERLATGGRWTEGPVWFGDGRYLLWSDIPNNRMLRWDEQTGAVSIFRSPSNYSNGNTRDRQGRLITCEHATRRLTRTEHDGRITVLIDRFEGKRLNAPNDVVVRSDGSIWFTDPGYGILMNYEGEQAEFELPRRVYRLDPQTGHATIVADDFDRPNGLCFSPDEKLLYIVDTGVSHTPDGPSHIRVFDVSDDGKLRNGRVFCDMKPGSADGIRTDRDGNLWVAAGWGGAGYDGVHCFTPGGELIGKIHLPEPCANLCFGGLKKNRLFMTAGQSLYSVYVEAVGVQWP